MSLFIVTIKQPKNPNHDPHNKITAKCSVSPECTDSTGAHHSMLAPDYAGGTAEEVRTFFADLGLHVTRVETA